MWDFHAKCVKLGRSDGAKKLQSRMHTARPRRAVLLAGLKERRRRQGGPECPKEIEEMNTYAKAKLKLF